MLEYDNIEFMEKITKRYIMEQRKYDWTIVKYLTLSICNEIKHLKKESEQSHQDIVYRHCEVMDKVIEAYGEEQLEMFLSLFVKHFENFIRLEFPYNNPPEIDPSVFKIMFIETVNMAHYLLNRYSAFFGKKNLFTENAVCSLMYWFFIELSKFMPSCKDKALKNLINDIFEDMTNLAMLLNLEEHEKEKAFDYIVTNKDLLGLNN